MEYGILILVVILGGAWVLHRKSKDKPIFGGGKADGTNKQTNK